MGFSQSATTHHFLLNSTGRVIQVQANDPADAASRDSVRMHLAHIAQAFQNGDFDIPMFVHDTDPPGVPEMKKLRASIHYSFEETPNGRRCRNVLHKQRRPGRHPQIPALPDRRAQNRRPARPSLNRSSIAFVVADLQVGSCVGLSVSVVLNPRIG
jgi:hypothetical protein